MKRLFLVLCLLAFVTGCASKAIQPVGDLVDLPQDAGAYHDLDPSTPLLAPDIQAAAFQRFLTEHFGPWHRTEPKHTAQNVFWGLDLFPKKELYGENTLKRDPAWLEKQRINSRVDAYPSMGRRAIAVTNTSMRVLPSIEPIFYDFKRAGEGFPFDYMQNSLVLAGTPLYVTHLSTDKAWVLVESRFAYGWVPVKEIAWVDNRFAEAYESGQYAAVTRDDVSVTDNDGNYRFTAHIGTILPVMEGGGAADGFVCLIPARTEKGDAVLKMAYLSDSVARKAPLAATPANFASLANNIMGKPYGWGGLYQGRDCSATTMDIMAAFGIFLPRNSSQQAKVGTIVSLEDMDTDDKKEMIVETGTPFLTLVRKPGHIMLYIGHRDDEPMVFHAIWGLKTEVDDGFGRRVIGRAVVTSLEPGIEMDDLADGSLLIESVSAITTLPDTQIRQ